MIKAIIFDYDGVLTEHHPESDVFSKVGESLNISAETLVSAVYDPDQWAAAKAGKIPENEHWKRIAEKLDLGVGKADWLREQLFGEVVVRSELISLIEKLKTDYKVVLLSNALPSFNNLWNRLKISPLFDLIVNSSEVEIAKPDAKIFRYAVDKLGISYSECLFVDDQYKNIHAAKKLGMQTLLYTRSSQIIQQIEAFDRENRITNAPEDGLEVSKAKQNEVESLKEVLELYKQHVREFEKQAAKHGPISVPSHVSIALNEAKEKVRETEDKIDSILLDREVTDINHNIPPGKNFVGRSKDLVRLKQVVLDVRNIVELEGLAGTGKTALSTELCYQLLHEKAFDAFVWISARDVEPNFDSILDTFSMTLNEKDTINLDIPEQKNKILDILKRTRTLVVFDSFENIRNSEVRMFIESVPEPSKVLLITREHRFTEAQLVILEGLSAKDGLRLIKTELERQGSLLKKQQSLDPYHDLIAVTGGNPFAIKSAIGQIRYKGSLISVISEIKSSEGEVFEKLFASAWKELDSDSRKLLCAFTAFGGDVDMSAILFTANVSSEKAIKKLIDLCLVENHMDNISSVVRYFIHPLTRLYAISKLGELSLTEQTLCERGMTHYIEKYKDVAGHRNWQAYQEFNVLDNDINNLIVLIRKMAEYKSAELTIKGCNTVTRYLYNKSLFRVRIELGELALEAANTINDLRSKILFLLEDVGWSSAKSGELDKAATAFAKVKELLDHLSEQEKQEVDVPWVKSRLALNNGIILRRNRKIPEALTTLKHGLESSQNIDDDLHRKRIQVQLRSEVGRTYIKRKDFDQATEQLNLSLSLSKELGDKVRYCKSAFVLADLYIDTQQLDLATKTLEEALEIAKLLDRPEYIGEVRLRQAKVMLRKAEETSRDAYRVFKSIGHRWGMKDAYNIMIESERINREG